MVDVYRDGTLYNTSKAIKNGQEYLFDWTMLNEYNSLQNYMDGAQADIKTSIENKGITVPSNATLDEYASYIDQISTRGWISGLKLYPTSVYSGDSRNQSTTASISREEGGVLYGLCGLGFTTGSDHTYRHNPLCVFKKVGSADIQYTVSDGVSLEDGSGDYGFSVYRSGNTIKAFIFTNHVAYRESQSYTRCTQYTWDIANNTLTASNLGNGTLRDYNPINYNADLVGYTEFSGSSWVNSSNVYYDSIQQVLYIYLTLK